MASIRPIHRCIHTPEGLSMLRSFLCSVSCCMLATVMASADTTGPGAFGRAVRDAGGEISFVFGDHRPFEQCHASTLVQAADGTVLAAWFAGTKEKHPDVGIWFARQQEGKWSEPFRIAKINETAHWNPVLFRDAEDEIHLFFKIGPEIPFWQTYWMSSEDNGQTWSEPVELVPGDQGGRGPVRSAPIVLSDGSWLAPASTEYQGWFPFADRSTDHGETWDRSENFTCDKDALGGTNAIQPTLWESEKGHVHALLRTQYGYIWKTESKDYGKTWAPVEKTELPNNNSGIEALRLPDGRVLLCYNPVGGNWGDRTPLDLAISSDDGETWKTVAHVEDDADKDSEFSYPSMKMSVDGKSVLLTYTWQRDKVRFWRIPLEVLAD
ncbi:MAG: neuraminidase (sialidase) [Candidatus Hydrogenedens sp.]|nr:neuraminidase (sialidase) [Candidatus Hydrogenedens sp.]